MFQLHSLSVLLPL